MTSVIFHATQAPGRRCRCGTVATARHKTAAMTLERVRHNVREADQRAALVIAGKVAPPWILHPNIRR